MSEAAKRERERLSKSAEAIAALDAAEQGGTSTPKKKKKKKVAEKTSTRGADTSSINAGAERLMQPMRIKLRAAVLAKNKPLAKSLRQRLVALEQSKL